MPVFLLAGLIAFIVSLREADGDGRSGSPLVFGLFLVIVAALEMFGLTAYARADSRGCRWRFDDDDCGPETVPCPDSPSG